MLATWRSQRAVTIGTFGHFVLYGLIDMNRSGSPNAGMSILASWFAVPLPSRRLAVDWPHGRRRRQRNSTVGWLNPGFEISLELGVLLFQFCVSFPFLFAFFLFFAKCSLQTFVFPLQPIDLSSLFFENSGKTMCALSMKWYCLMTSYRMRICSINTHPPYVEILSGICPANSFLFG